jgi:inner membrane protein
MPAVFGIWSWTFLMETDEAYIVGEMPSFNMRPGVKRILAKAPKDVLIGRALKTKLGKLFQNFTPYVYMYHSLEDGKHVIRFCDLRYYIREDFLHNATVIFDETLSIIDAVFQPYDKKRKIRIMG